MSNLLGTFYFTHSKGEGTQKLITLETAPTPHYCPSCGFRMYSRGINTRKIYLMHTYDYESKLFAIDPRLKTLRDHKEMYITFNSRNI